MCELLAHDGLATDRAIYDPFVEQYPHRDQRVLRSAGSADPQRYAQDAVRLYEQGWPIRRVAEEFGVSYGTMRRLLMNNTELRSHGWNENR